MSRAARISRRTLLRGVGVTVALPLLDAMLPFGAAEAAAATGGRSPTRLLWCYVPNGVHLPDWVPNKEGGGFDLPPRGIGMFAFPHSASGAGRRR